MLRKINVFNVKWCNMCGGFEGINWLELIKLWNIWFVGFSKDRIDK